MKQIITPCLWFDGQARQAADFYLEVFPGSRLDYDSGLTVGWTIGDLSFMGLNGGPGFRVNPSISFFWNSASEPECRQIWGQLLQGGKVLMPLDTYDFSPCYGWVEDRFGVNWQIMYRQGPVDCQVHPSLMFNGPACGKAREALEYWTMVFPGSGPGIISTYAAGMEPDREGTINYGELNLGSQRISVMDSARDYPFSFNEGISLMISVETQEELDHYWTLLCDGGEESMCGWLKDRYGISWQVVPKILATLMSDPERRDRVVAAFMKMRKLDIPALMKA